jgi:hypothetical protein
LLFGAVLIKSGEEAINSIVGLPSGLIDESCAKAGAEKLRGL